MQCKTEGCSNEVLSKGLCKKCYEKARYKANKKNILDKYNLNKETILSKKKKRYIDNKEIMLNRAKEYRESNKERIKGRNEARKELKPLYTVWQGMKTRCNNSNATGYKDYGGRDIKVCDRWLNSYDNFALDMGERPEGTSLDRIDVNGNYEPLNCRWATAKEQANNKRKKKQ